MGALEPQERLIDQPLFNKLLILAVAATWGCSFVFMKGLVDKVPVFWLLTMRYGLATLSMGLLLRGRLFAAFRDRSTIFMGLVLGVLVFAAYATQTMGLSMTTPGKNAFFTGCYCVMTPFAAWLFGLGRPRASHVIAAVVCVVGIGFVAMSGTAPLNLGDALTLLCAVFYAMQYAVLARWGSDADSLAMTTIQFAVMAVLSLAMTCIFERGEAVPPLTVSDMAALAFLVLVCSCFDFAALNWGMTKIDTTEGSILSALEAPFGVLASILLYGEPITARLILGFCLIFASIVIAEAGEVLFSCKPKGALHV